MEFQLSLLLKVQRSHVFQNCFFKNMRRILFLRRQQFHSAEKLAKRFYQAENVYESEDTHKPNKVFSQIKVAQCRKIP